MKKNSHLFLLFFMVMLTFGLFPTRNLAQEATQPKGKVTRVEGPLQALLRQSALRQRNHHAGFLKPIESYGNIPGLTGTGASFKPLSIGNASQTTTRRIMRTPDGTELWGMLINRTSWSDLDSYDRPYGVYSFSTHYDSLKTLYTDNYYMEFNGGAVFYNDVLHGTNYYEYDGTLYYVYCYEYNTETWEQNGYGNYSDTDFSIISYATAWDPTSGKVYAFNRDQDGTSVDFSTLDYSVPTATKIASTERTYVALAINNQGEAFAIGLDGNLYRIDKSDGTSTLVGSTGVTPAEVLQSAVFDQKSGTLYWAAINSDKTSSLYTIDTTTGTATKVFDFTDGEEFVAIYVPTVANPDAPSPATNLTANFSNGELSGTIEFDIPTTNIGGNTLTGDVNYVVIADETDTLANGVSEAGQHVSAAVTMKQAGKHTISVILSNDAGASKATKLETEWIGNDQPYVVEDVTFTLDTLTREAKLTWPAVTKGWNGGYVNPDSISYTITDFYTEEVIVENYQDTSYTFTLQKEEYRPYRYTVQSYYGDVASEWGVSCDPVKWGTPLSAPYSNTFDSYKNFDILDIIDANNDRCYFKFSGQGLVLQSPYSYNSSSFDDWAVLPPLSLESGRLYYLSFDASNSAFSDYGEKNSVQVEAGVGADLNVGTYSIFMPSTDINPDESKQVQGILKVDNSGVYRMGIHAICSNIEEGNTVLLNISNLNLTAGPMLSAPDSVTNIQLKADPTGLQSVDITFTTPTKDLNGTQLTSLTKVEVYRGDSLIHTFDAPATGSQLSLTDENMGNGSVSYTFLAYNVNGEGMPNSASVMVGMDYPAAPINVAVSDNLDGSAVMTWDAPTIGKNGRVIDPEALTYNIYGADETKVAEGLTNRSYEFSGLPTDGEQYVTGLYVAAQNEIGEGDKALGVVFAGKAYTLPFHESFPEGNPTYSTWIGKTAQTFNLFTSMAQDGDQGCMAFVQNSQGEPGIICSGKISLQGMEKPKLSFYYWAVPHAKCEIQVLIARNGIENPDTVGTFSLRNGDQGWQKAMIDLTPYQSENGYITLQFLGRSWDVSVPPIIDNITIDAARDNDLAVSLNSPSRANVGANTQFQVKVSNEGNNDAENALLSLSINDSIVSQQQVSVPAATITYTNMSYVISANLKDKLTAKVSLEWTDDEFTDNNESAVDSVKIIRQDLPVVTLNGQLDENGKPNLTWTAPADTGYIHHESFENYDPFSITNVGYWTLHDEDSTSVNGIGGSYYEHMFEPCAYMVFNPELAYLDLSATPQFAPHTGDQYMAAFTCGSLADNYDWLISPELSGQAQTITFYCRSVSEENGLESYSVYYSTTGTDIDDFIPIIEDDEASADQWDEVNVELPQGAKYFAIVCTSSNQFLFMVDDITYEGKPISATGYNIYRDGKFIATVDASTLSYTDEDVDNESVSHVYNVTMLAEQGESDYSNDVTLTADATAIRSITTDGVKERYNVAGQRISGSQMGIQIVRTKDGKTHKVIKK